MKITLPPKTAKLLPLVVSGFTLKAIATRTGVAYGTLVQRQLRLFQRINMFGASPDVSHKTLFALAFALQYPDLARQILQAHQINPNIPEPDIQPALDLIRETLSNDG